MQMIQVPVSDTTVDAVQHNGSVWVPVRRVCESLGLSADAQRVKLSAKPWACTAIIAVHATTRLQPTFCVRLDSLPMWLATIDHDRVDGAVVHRLISFQREAHDALAAHFGVSGRTVTSTARPSGGASGSGAPSTTAMNAVVGTGSVLDLLAITDNLSGAVRATFLEAQAARAVADAASDRADAASDRADAAHHRADDADTLARLAMEEAKRATGRGILVARRRAAVGHITRAVKSFCAKQSVSYVGIYSELRRDLGLPRERDGGPALGGADLRADQVVRRAGGAGVRGVPDCGPRVIEAILMGSAIAPPTIDMAPSTPARTTDVVDQMLGFATGGKPTGPVQ